MAKHKHLSIHYSKNAFRIKHFGKILLYQPKRLTIKNDNIYGNSNIKCKLKFITCHS